MFNYTDHLGNIRLSYGIDPNTQALTKFEENNYYPFGLKHKNYNYLLKEIQEKKETIITQEAVAATAYSEAIPEVKEDVFEKKALLKEEEYFDKVAAIKNQEQETNVALVANSGYNYKYQGQERQDELGLNWDSFKWRNYDYAIGRFMSIDPLTEKYMDWAPYVFSGNRLIDSRELEGLEPHTVHKTLDDAGLNFVSQYNGLSIRMKGEIGTYFYSKQVNGETVYSYIQPVGSPNGKIIDPGSGIDTIPKGGTLVGNGHTHMEDVNRVEKDENGKVIYDESNNFSHQDLERADTMKSENKAVEGVILGTPNGKALRYTPSGNTGDDRSKDIKAISRDMPRDPNSKTNIKNTVSPNTVPSVLPYGTTQEQVDKLPKL